MSVLTYAAGGDGVGRGQLAEMPKGRNFGVGLFTDELEQSWAIFQANSDELLRLLQEDDPAVLLSRWDIRNREEFSAFLDEVGRLLHNFVAATMTLVDHQRNLVRKLPSEEGDQQMLIDEYQRRVAELFAEEPLAQFVQCLRHFILHRRLPVSYGQLTWTVDDNPPLGSSVRLQRQDLLKWDGWNATAKRFLEDRLEDIDLEEVVIAYRTRAGELHRLLTNPSG